MSRGETYPRGSRAGGRAGGLALSIELQSMVTGGGGGGGESVAAL